MKYIVRTPKGKVRFYQGKISYEDIFEGPTEFGTQDDARNRADQYNLEDYSVTPIQSDSQPINLTEISF